MTSTLTRPEAEQAIYIDFEGTQKDPPVMLGIYWVTPDGEEHLEQLVFNPVLNSAALAKSLNSEEGACVMVDSLETAFKRVQELSEWLGVPIVEWSFREEQVLDASELPAEMIKRIRSRVKNGLPVARRWARRTLKREDLKPDKRGKRYTLPNFAKVTGYEIPALYGAGNSASRVREVMRQIESRGSYGDITGVAKRKWHSFLKHNEHDLRATRHVMLGVIPPAPKPTRRGRQGREYPYETSPHPDDSCPDCGGVLSRYIYGMVRELPTGHISGGCIIWEGKPDYRCDYCWEDFKAVTKSRPRRITRRERCVQMIAEWGWSRKSVATNQGVPVEVLERWISESNQAWILQ